MPFHDKDSRAGGVGGRDAKVVRITGTGRHVPGHPLTNEEVLALTTLPESVTAEWITERVRIKTRHCARKMPFERDGVPEEGQHCSDMAAEAAKNALDMAGLKFGDLDLLVVATATPDFPVPATSTMVQEKLARLYRAAEQKARGRDSSTDQKNGNQSQKTPLGGDGGAAELGGVDLEKVRDTSPRQSTGVDATENAQSGGANAGFSAGSAAPKAAEEVVPQTSAGHGNGVMADMGEDFGPKAELAAMDVRSACCGSTQALITALNMLENGYFRTACVVGVDIGSVFGDVLPEPGVSKMECVNVCMMGDAAGAVVLEAFDVIREGAEGDQEDIRNAWGERKPGMEISFTTWKSIGSGTPPGMWLPAGGSVHPVSTTAIVNGLHRFHHNFRTVIEHGPDLYLRALKDTLAAMKYSLDDIDCFVPHQANGHVHAIATKVGVPADRVYENFSRVGNTANGSLFLCLDELVRRDTTDGSDQEHMLPPGSNVLLLAAESTKWLYGSVLVKYQPLLHLQKGGVENAIAYTQRARMSPLQRLYASFVLNVGGYLLSLKNYFSRRSR